jgi:hypothetical protein
VRPRIAFPALTAAVLVSCVPDVYGQTPPSPPAPRIELPTPASTDVGRPAPTYDRKGRRDPFEPVGGVQSGLTTPAIASAQLKGILRGQTLRVLVETPDGLGYVLAVGDMLGEGRLIEIRADSAVFSVPARTGSTTDRVVLRLPED